MRVLMLGWELPPYNSGGLGVACFQLCQALASRGIDIEFILPYAAKHEADFMTITAAQPIGVSEIISTSGAYDSYKYRYEDGHEEWHDIYSQQAFYERAVARLAHQKTFDIVHAHDWLTFRAALRVKEMTGCPIVLHVHSVESDRAGGQRGNPLVHEIEETAFLLADQIIAVSNHTKKAIMRDYDIPADRITVIHNSINQQDLPSVDPHNAYEYLVELKQHGYRIVSNVGRLTVQKGLPNLLRAARKVIDKAPKTIFLVVGSGEQYQELVELAAELGIGRNVIFTGFLRGKQWRDAFAIADLFVMPSVSEPFGLTPLEAICYGTPSLVSKQAGVSEVLKNCLKVDSWDIDEMANQIISVVRSDALRRELTANAYRELSGLSWHHSAQKVHDLYGRHVMQGAAA